ncbi:shewanella-like protein phosphatase 2 [Magnolia sinica]|uniref:shewanella-like protein phosphatase 2 n=1 Tax=Magnolia sinica TaxID=86752 RepID=UPI002658CD42|nr:shewanella-like protein phosphatase 2 [Magnolia sinica]
MEESSSLCKSLPHHFSSFVDAFVDFSVSGLFLSNAPTAHDSITPPLQTRLPSPSRLVAIGDLHGDLKKTRQALSVAGLIDPISHRWIAGSTVAVQVGDVLDRGSDEIKLLYFLETLKRDAARQGGAFLTMIGNHEVMNIDGDFRFVTPSGLEDFRLWAHWYRIGNSMKSLCEGLAPPDDVFQGIPKKFNGIREEFHDGFHARLAALRPNGPIARRFFSDNPTVLVVGNSVFVHGGLLEDHVMYGLERINMDVRDWINGLRGRISPGIVRGRNSVVWARQFSNSSEKNCDCSMLEHVLTRIPGVKRMIMGHTIQETGINGVCQNQAIRIDVGMSRGCGDGLPEVLEIDGNSGEIRVLTSNPLYRRNRFESGLEIGGKEGLAMLVPEQGSKQVEVNA